jgi:hypothetical protein
LKPGLPESDDEYTAVDWDMKALEITFPDVASRVEKLINEIFEVVLIEHMVQVIHVQEVKLLVSFLVVVWR